MVKLSNNKLSIEKNIICTGNKTGIGRIIKNFTGLQEQRKGRKEDEKLHLDGEKEERAKGKNEE